MLDRLISGAGAITDLADRFARVFTRRASGNVLGSRPGSLIVAAGLGVLAVALILVGIEATDNPTPRTLDAATVATSQDLGGRTYATVSGGIASAYVETYLDENDNGTQDADEKGKAWFYFLMDPDSRSGVVVRSTRPPTDVFHASGTGRIFEDAAYVKEDASLFAEEVAALGLHLDDRRGIDATTVPAGTPVPLDLAAELPAAETAVAWSGARIGTIAGVCSTDVNGDGQCDPTEYDLFDIVVYDPVSKHAITVVVAEDPEFQAGTFTGMLRRDEQAVSDAKSADSDTPFIERDLTLNDAYILDDGKSPANAPLSFGVAALAILLATLLLAGFVGGYLRFRRSGGPEPTPARTFAPGERLPIKVTGNLRTSTGLIHVREAPADLVRFVAEPEPEPPAPPAALTEASEAAAPTTAAPTTATLGAAPVSTLIIERRSKPEGVAVGRGELTGLQVGSGRPFRGGRPALRLTAGTGKLILTFDDEASRDRAAAELAAEAGIGGTGSIPAWDLFAPLTPPPPPATPDGA